VRRAPLGPMLVSGLSVSSSSAPPGPEVVDVECSSIPVGVQPGSGLPTRRQEVLELVDSDAETEQPAVSVVKKRKMVG
jgi:hypothetical protein